MLRRIIGTSNQSPEPWAHYNPSSTVVGSGSQLVEIPRGNVSDLPNFVLLRDPLASLAGHPLANPH